MPVHTISTKLSNVDSKYLTTAVAVGMAAYALKIYSGGRKSIWEREWGGKLIIIAAPPEPTTFALMDKLLRLPSPPQILYLPPLASPLPQSLLTVLHAMKLAASGNPLAQLNCEPLPPTPKAVREFTRKWAATPYGTVGEGGRRVDAIVLGGNWECTGKGDGPKSWRPSLDEEDDGVRWTPAQYHFHFVTSLLPHLLKAPAERNIRIVELVSPAWSAALPGVEKSMAGQAPAAEKGLLPIAAKKGITSLLVQTHLALILNTLASAAYSKKEVVPNPDAPVKELKKRDSSVQSNILALSVVMPWARDEVLRPVWGKGGFLNVILWIILYPLIVLITPSPAQSVQSVLFALNAPTTFVNDATADYTGNKDVAAADNIVGDKPDGEAKPKDTSKGDEPLPLAQRGVKQGSVVRDCQTIELPGVLHDETLARATYDRIEEEVTRGVVESESLEKERAEAQPKKAASTSEKADRPSVDVPKPSVKKAKSATGAAGLKPTTLEEKVAAVTETSPAKGKAGEGPSKGQKRADEVAGQERTDPTDTLSKNAFVPDAKQHRQSQARAKELAQQLGVDDKVKPGESFADAVKEGPAAHETAHHDSRVHKGESFADALKEHTGAQHTSTQHASTQVQGAGHVHPGESFADALKEHQQ